MTTNNLHALSICEATTNYNEENLDLFTLITGITGEKTSEFVQNFLDSVCISEYSTLSLSDIQKFGFKKASANRLLLSLKLVGKLKKLKAPEKYTIRSPKDAALYLMDEMSELKQENFVVLFLNTKNQVIGKQTIFIGGLAMSIAHPREVFREAVKKSCANVIISHNHPSGNPSPSSEDLDLTKRMVEAGLIMGIEVLDHVIIGDRQFISLKEKGYM
jgi:DNA repair protein RadC